MQRIQRFWSVTATSVTLMLAAALGGPTQVLADDEAEKLWIHVAVDEKDTAEGDGETVRINFPLALAAKMLLLMDDGDGSRHFKINNEKVDIADLREMWEVAREAPEGKFVSVESQGEDVEVAREGNYMVVRVDEPKEKVNIKLPIPVVDALLAGTGEELNLEAACDALIAHGPGELVSVVSDEETVRIWVDKNHAPR